jgi:hypothetical protein
LYLEFVVKNRDFSAGKINIRLMFLDVREILRFLQFLYEGFALVHPLVKVLVCVL